MRLLGCAHSLFCPCVARLLPVRAGAHACVTKKFAVEVGFGEKAAIQHHGGDRRIASSQLLASRLNAKTVDPLRHVFAAPPVDDAGQLPRGNAHAPRKLNQAQVGIAKQALRMDQICKLRQNGRFVARRCTGRTDDGRTIKAGRVQARCQRRHGG